MKKILSAFLAMVMVLAVVPMSVSAIWDKSCTYEVVNVKVTIIDVSTAISGNVAVPNTLGGYPVTKNDISYEFLKPIPGDITGNNKVNISDISLLLKYIAKWDVVLK